ncbi:MAG: LacI family DNA-binding transcriptional regulator [Fidelibacterota bacterium]|nr:MAG: LacI family DNA-binding transcriptional regulator [Candidatus Neomarinimicrobiota bacterium]
MNGKPHPTIKDIAEKLGISASTVSRALHDHPAISQETKRKVLALAEKLGYYPDSIAQSLQKRWTKVIGVLVPEIRHHFFSAAIAGIEEVAYEDGYTIIVSQSNESFEREVINTRSMISHRVAGLIVSIAQTTVDGQHLSHLLQRGIPLVLFDRILEELEVSKVIVDDYEGAFKAIEHLIRSGYRRIAHLAGPPHLHISRERLRGYIDALMKHDYPPDEALIVHGGLSEEDGAAGFRALWQLPQRPDAIFAVNDPVAVGAFQGIKATGLRIPDDIGLVGFSNNPITEIIDPPLTTVDQHGYTMGQVAAQLLLNEIKNGDESARPVTKVVKTELIIRGSSSKKGAGQA